MKSQPLLSEKLYQAEDLKQGESGVSATIRLNRDSDVFRGHFPDHPILPGVCTVQIIKEILSEAIAKELQMRRATNIKFMAFVDPFENECVELDVQYAYGGENLINCNARVYSGQVTFCSFKGEFAIRA